ncbi:MAG: GvpL/GvpF family gas vesicle protein, partial [Isosphaeraceae bacterium]
TFDRLLNANREAHLERITQALGSHTVEIQSNPPRSERDVVNLACLVERERLHGFEQGVLEVARRFDNNFAFDINGPWPPHNFVEIRLQLS